MKLYDRVMEECQNLLAPYEKKVLSPGTEVWPDVGENNMILKSEMAYELGGGNNVAGSGLCFTTDGSKLAQDEILLYGPDLSEIKKDTPYGRLTLISVEPELFSDANKAYSALRKIEYTRYHTNPYGYMMRISTASDREVVRIGKEALENGLDFAKVGQAFLTKYHDNNQVKAVRIIFITEPDFPYDALQKLMRKSEQITDSMDHIFKDLVMDCSVCNLKPVCDEVEGMRALHFQVSKQ